MLLKYAFKSGRVMGQFGAAGVLAVAGIGLLFSTVSRWRYDSALREAIFAATSNVGDPRAALDEAVSLRPDDPFPTLLRAQWLLERGAVIMTNADPDPAKAADAGKGAAKQLSQAVKDYDAAIKKTKELPGSSESYQSIAVAGAAAARCALADADPSQRAELLEQATKVLEQAPSSDDPDLLGVRAGLALAKGEVAAANKVLTEMSGKLAQASRTAAGSYYWNHGLVLLLGRDPECAFELERAALFRRSAENGRVLGLAIRVAAADPAVPSKSNEALSARLAGLRKIISYRVRVKAGAGVSRFGMDNLEEGRCWNAIGIGHCRAFEADKALEAFTTAQGSNTKEFIYRSNRAYAFKVKAEHPPAEEKDPKQWEHDHLEKFASGTEQAALLLLEGIKDKSEKDKADIDKLGQAYMNTAAVWRWKIFEPPEITTGPIEAAKDKFHMSEAECNRSVGALKDWFGQLVYAVPSYKRAIALGHKDSGKMASRVELYEHDVKKGK